MRLKRTHAGVFPCGKHSNDFDSDIRGGRSEHLTSGCEFKDPRGTMPEFQEYVSKLEETGSEQAVPKQQPCH